MANESHLFLCAIPHKLPHDDTGESKQCDTCVPIVCAATSYSYRNSFLEIELRSWTNPSVLSGVSC